MIKEIIKAVLKYMRFVAIAFMLALANVFKGEMKTIDDTTYKIEHVEDIKEDSKNPD